MLTWHSGGFTDADMKSRWTWLPIIFLAVLCVTSCGTLSKHAARREGIAKMMTAKYAALGCIMYAGDHGGQYPASFSGMAGYFKGNTNTLNDLIAGYDLVYTSVDTNIAKPAETIIIKGKQPWQHPGTAKVNVYAFADGHCEIHAQPDANFEAWENERMVKP